MQMVKHLKYLYNVIMKYVRKNIMLEAKLGIAMQNRVCLNLNK